MFYFDSDKIEIKGWIKRDILILQSRIEQVESFQKSSDIFAEVEKYVLNQLAQNNAEYIAQISMLKKEIENLKSKSDSVAALQAEISDLRNKNKIPEDKIASLKPESTAALQAEISDLRNKNKIPEDKIASLKPESTASLQAELSDLRNKNKIPEDKIASLKPESTASLQAEISDLRNKNKILEDKIASLKPESTASLQAEISDLRNQNKILSSKNFALETEIKKIWQEIKKSAAEKITVQTPVQIPIQEKTESKIEISSPPPVESPEKIFYLPTNDKVFITDKREKILEKVQQALKVEEIQKFLAANNSETSQKFQKLIKVHLQGVQNFINKLNLDDSDDEELSENITPKYFKLFHQIIFDNFLVAIKRGLRSAEKDFYLELLKKTNEYLSRAGIYTVNAKSDVKVSDEDFENMTAQTVKTADKNKIDFIKEIERLPYRINYLDEFGEQKYFQYNGVMTIFKAVR